ncbi:hypothetical protein FGD67_16240 [Colwellia sp. M166]|nr:hypothetical protein FGD67_16240 [Colwellia sp. M166]
MKMIVYFRQLLLRCSNDSHPCENLIEINSAACKPFKITLRELNILGITHNHYPSTLVGLRWLSYCQTMNFHYHDKRQNALLKVLKPQLLLVLSPFRHVFL